MRNVFELELSTKIPADNSYFVSYPHLLKYFTTKSLLMAGDVVCGAHMVYGWMPTILELNGDLEAAAQTLNEAKAGRDITAQKITKVAATINNSFVGASKLLHFVAPKDRHKNKITFSTARLPLLLA